MHIICRKWHGIPLGCTSLDFFNSVKKEARKLLTEAENQFYSEKFNETVDPKSKWSAIKSLTNKKF